jgi:hypothetical protein
MNLVLTLDVGTRYGYLTVPTIEAYAKKIGAEFLVISDLKLFKKYPHFEKFQIYDLLNSYDRIIYFDSDVLIKPDCPNLFEIVPEDRLALFNEGCFRPWDSVLKEASIRYSMEYTEYKEQYYNTGVMVIPKKCQEVFNPPQFELDVFAGCAAYDQPYINLKIREQKIEVFSLDYQYNRLEYIDKLTGESRFESHIIHYAGINDDMRLKIIPEDIEKIKQNVKVKRNILITMGGGMGDQIDGEPVVRYIVEQVYPGENVKLISDWPELFTHIGVPVCKRAEFKLDCPYFPMETLPSDKHPLWNFLSQAICHTTDFASIACLRTIIPDKFKTIKLNVNERSFKKLDKLIPTSLEDLILVHPGRGWPSKTFPADWWIDIINGLIDAGEKVAIIGKYISEEQGYVELNLSEIHNDVGSDSSNCYDLLDLLDTNDLVALISKAKCVVTNDSAPVHIAGAFDNYIVLIPTCKHPDHVLPFRNSDKYYKAIAPYKKLTCDALDSRPTNLNGESIDKVLGDIRGYLPDPKNMITDILKLIK